MCIMCVQEQMDNLIIRCKNEVKSDRIHREIVANHYKAPEMKLSIGDQFIEEFLGDAETGEIVKIDTNFVYVQWPDMMGIGVTVSAYAHDTVAERILNGSWKYIPLGDGSDCQHQWLKYVGFTEVYDYCDKCGKKKV